MILIKNVSDKKNKEKNEAKNKVYKIKNKKIN